MARMAFKDAQAHPQSIELLQRSLKRGRLAHAYLFAGQELEHLENIARTLAKTLNCEQPVTADGAAVDSCDRCLACRKIDHGNHPDVHWLRPESKSRIITTEQIRDLSQEIHLKPSEAAYKVAVIVAADRLRIEAANAFLKTLEEPPAKSILILLTIEPQRILETIVSRCLRLSFAGDRPPPLAPHQNQWLMAFTESAATHEKSLLGRYRLLDVLLQKLTELKKAVEETLTARSPLQQYQDAEKSYIDKWEDELAAAIEAEYRRQRSDLLGIIHWWLRDVWVWRLNSASPKAASPEQKEGHRDLLRFPEISETKAVAGRISAQDALTNLEIMEQVRAWLDTNVQEALALEVGLLKLRL